MREKKAIIKKLNITRKGEFKVFQLKLPFNVHQITGIEICIRLAKTTHNKEILDKVENNESPTQTPQYPQKPIQKPHSNKDINKDIEKGSSNNSYSNNSSGKKKIG